MTRVYDLQFNDQIFEVEAHDSEVLSIEYSPKTGGKYMYTHSYYNTFQFLGVGEGGRGLWQCNAHVCLV